MAAGRTSKDTASKPRNDTTPRDAYTAARCSAEECAGSPFPRRQGGLSDQADVTHGWPQPEKVLGRPTASGVHRAGVLDSEVVRKGELDLG